MTFFSRVGKGKASGRGNRKDAPGRRPKPEFDDGDYEAVGFARHDWNKWRYTIRFIQGCPEFVLSPKTHINGEGKARFGLMARHGSREIFFAQGTNPQEMASQLTNAILDILDNDHLVYVYDGNGRKVQLVTPVNQEDAVYWLNRINSLRQSFGFDLGDKTGIEPGKINHTLFDCQQAVVERGLVAGRCAISEKCGLGK